MDELTEPARRLISAAMEEDVPDSEAADKSWGIVVSRVVDVVEPVPQARTTSGAMPWILGGVVAAVIAIAIATRTPAVSPTTESTPKADAAPTSAVKTVAPPHEAPPPHVSTIPTVIDDEAANARLLDEAEAVLARDPAAALALIERHAGSSAADTDVPRRLAVRIEALCALGRLDDARGETTAFLRLHGETSWATRVRNACGVAR